MGWDSNPRSGLPRSAVFKTAAFNRSATHPHIFFELLTIAAEGEQKARSARGGHPLWRSVRDPSIASATAKFLAAHRFAHMPSINQRQP